MKFTFAPEATPLAGFTIKRAIDRGGFGEVYYALSDSGKEVALKLLQHNQQIELRGIRQCLNLKHPNLVTIFDIKTDADEDHWVVMEYVSGQSLEQVLDGHPQGLPAAEVESWLSGIASGIGFLHDRGIVHRDLKPANVFRENGVVKIGDVGLSKFITPSRRSAQTESVGTVYYMAPEVAHGKYGSELDIYSLGIIVYEMLTGRVPFDGESTGEILMKHLTEPPDLAPLAPALRPVVARALEKDPQRRTPSADQLAQDFRRALQGKPIAEEIPASHFVDVQRLERKVALESPSGSPRHAASPAAFNRYGQRGHASSQLPPSEKEPQSEPQLQGLRFLFKEWQRKPWLAAAMILVGLVLFAGARDRALLRQDGIKMLIPVSFVYVAFWSVKNRKRLLPRFMCRTGAGKRGGGYPPCGNPGGNTAKAVFDIKLNGGFDDRDGAVANGARAYPVSSPPPPPEPRVVVLPVKQETPKPAPQQNQAVPTPNTPRQIPLRSRLADVSSSMTLAVFWSLVATALVGLAVGALVKDTRGLIDPAHAALFAITTILGSWAILLPAKMLEGNGPETTGRRLIATALGGAVGACAWWLGQALFVSPPFASAFPGLFRRVLQHPLVWGDAPTLAGYTTFFAALFALRRWWWQADAYRPNKFRIRSFLWTGVVAFFVPALFSFPQGWAVSWALAMSAVVHLSSPWVAPKDRPPLAA